MFKKLIGALVGIAVLGMAGAAQASLIGDEVTASFNTSFGGVLLSPTTSIVTTGGPEFVLDFGSGRAINIDVGGSFIDFQYSNVSNSGLGDGNLSVTLADLDWVGMVGSIIDVQLTEFDDILPQNFTFGLNTVTFTDHSVTLNLNGTWDGTDRVRLDLITSHVIPLPAALPLFLTGLAGLGLMRRRKRQALRE